MKLQLLIPTLIATATSTLPLHAVTLYSDTLTSAEITPLNGSTVEISNAYAGATAGAIWTAGPDLVRGGTGAERPGGATGANDDHAYLSFTPQAGFVYTLQATLSPQGGSWFSLGFSASNSTTINWQDSPNNPVFWGLVRQPGGGNPQFFQGTGTGGGGAFGLSTLSGLQTVTITMDTTGANWSATIDIAGSTATRTFTGAPTINYVGFGTDNGPGFVSDFSLTAVPEPTSVAMLGLAAGGFALLRLRRRQKQIAP